MTYTDWTTFNLKFENIRIFFYVLNKLSGIVNEISILGKFY